MAGNYTPNWFDFIVFIILAVGFIVGRKRGMSQSWLGMLKWAGMACASVLGVSFVAGYLERLALLTPPSSRLLGYLAIALVIYLVVGMLEKALQDKLARTDFFGRFEYPLGMVAGMVQAACMVLIFLALIHSRVVTDADRKAAATAKKEGEASSFFPAFCDIHDGIFKESVAGRFVKTKANWLLLAPVGEAERPEKPESLKNKQQRTLNQIIGDK